MSDIEILKRLFDDYSKKYLKKISLAFFLSLVLAASTSSVAYLLDPAIKQLFIEKNQTLLLHAFNEVDKTEGIYSLKYSPGAQLKMLSSGPSQYRSIQQAQEGKELIFTQANFSTFPDIKSTRSFKKINTKSRH